ncbi:hypothetical protein FPOA_05448 [Fusarium poae]|uniref:Uncharacterized protein n=1 Tax=Fusarium poae TaxID=36050 RepID=A0A1B8AWL0_FUSPO|nr:hypothetical protein FPOA_05448 [Fusarium poae]
MRPFYLAWVLCTTVAYSKFFDEIQKDIRYWLIVDWPRAHEWKPAWGSPSLEKLEMEQNGTLKGPKVYIPNPGFELNMGKPWKIVGKGVEVVRNVSLSRKGKNSLLFTLKDGIEPPEVYSVHLKSLKAHQVYYVTFHYRVVDLKYVPENDPCFIGITLGDMVMIYPIFAKRAQSAHQLLYEQRRYKRVTVPMYSWVGVSPLSITVFCGLDFGNGALAKVSIDDIRLEKGEGRVSDWAFDLPRPEYRYYWRDTYVANFENEDARWYVTSHFGGIPVNCRQMDLDGWDCLVAGGDYRRQDLWDDGVRDYWPIEDQPSRGVSEMG